MTRIWPLSDLVSRISSVAFPLLEERLLRSHRLNKSEMAIRLCRSHAPAGRSLKESILNEERLVNFLDGPLIFADCRGDRAYSDGSALEFLDDRLENARVHVVEAKLIDVE